METLLETQMSGLSSGLISRLLKKRFQFRFQFCLRTASVSGFQFRFKFHPRKLFYCEYGSFKYSTYGFPKREAILFLWLPEKGSHITFVWPFVHFLTLPAAVTAKLLFQFKSDLEF